MKNNKNIMVLGTSSGAGKSIVTTGLCRVFYKDGYSVTPFKAQNMALNSFVTKEGLEIGRSQAVQARASGIEPSGYMNPLLLKPCGEGQIQIILNGKPFKNMSGYEFTEKKREFKKYILDAYKETEKFDITVLEGAGSPVEINIRDNDLVNMGMAEMADAPVILVADIDRGGVFASIVGTFVLLREDERKRVKGVVINKFRGRKDLLVPGLEELENIIKVPVLGVLPYSDFDIEDEDGVTNKRNKIKNTTIKIGVINLHHLSNFTDLDPLKKIGDVSVEYVNKKEELDDKDIIIIPGSKNTISDMEMIREKGFDKKIEEIQKDNNKIIIGICGGFQILGKTLEDAVGIEGKKRKVDGLNFFDIDTLFYEEKLTEQYSGNLENTSALLEGLNGEKIKGFEIHHGRSFSSSLKSMSSDSEIKILSRDNILGTYVHGIFENTSITEKILNRIRESKGKAYEKLEESFEEYREKQFEKLETVIRENLDMEKIYKIMEDR